MLHVHFKTATIKKVSSNHNVSVPEAVPQVHTFFVFIVFADQYERYSFLSLPQYLISNAIQERNVWNRALETWFRTYRSLMIDFDDSSAGNTSLCC